MIVPGYWNDPQATAESFVGGFWRSGDIGSLDADGYLRVFDRRKDIINRGGYKIYSAEIENVLSFHPAVIECAAIACPDPVLGEKIQVFVRCNEDYSDSENIRQFCASRLADYKIPDFVVFLNEPLPRNANGKIIKTQLRNSLNIRS
jgi:acyl-CoA synthetase (AMP-forming)/AMP-acid ligase II